MATQWKRVKGIQDEQTREFFPYPLAVCDLDIWDQDHCEVTVTAETLAADPDYPLWAEENVYPVVEFKMRCVLSGTNDLGLLLIRRARQLGVELEDLPNPIGDLIPVHYEREMIAARIAIRRALWFPILCLANMDEISAPGGIRVPRHLELPSQPLRKISIEEVVRSPKLRQRARETFIGDELAAFNAYCAMWEASRVSLRDTAHVEGDLHGV